MGMDMKVKTGNPLLTAMICVALSSGTAWAAVPELPASAFVQQQNKETADYNAAALAQSSAMNVVEEKKAEAKRGGEPDLSGGTFVEQPERGQSANDFRHMPLRWQTVKTPKEIQAESKPQPLIITADDIEKQRKEQKRQEAAASLRQDKRPQQTAAQTQPLPQEPPVQHQAPAGKPQPEVVPPQQVQQTAPALPAAAVPSAASVRMGAYYQPESVPPKILKPVEPQSAEPQKKLAVQPADRTPENVPQPLSVQPPAVRREESSPQPARQENAVPPSTQASNHLPALEPSGSVPQAGKPQSHPFPDMAWADRPAPAVNNNRNRLEDAGNVPGKLQVERPPEYDGISDEVVRHILAGEFAMMYQLSHDPTEPGIYKLAKILKDNNGLTHLQKIEYLIGFGRAINKSDLSEWQKLTFIKTVSEAFDE